MPPLSELSVAERAALLRACHCEEKVLLGQIEHARDQLRQGFPGAEPRLTVKESELQILRAVIRKLWQS
jgi:hypothetical protein